MRSLRARLFLVAAITVAVALGAVGVMSRQAAHTEFLRFERIEHAARIEQLALDLSRRLEPSADSATVSRALAEAGRVEHRDLLLVAPDGRVLGASSPDLGVTHVTLGPGTQIAIDRRVRRGPTVSLLRAVLAGGPRGTVRRADGTELGRLVMLPAEDNLGATPFGVTFDLRLSIAALAAGLVALALSWWLSRRILRPVDELTLAARRLGTGDLAARVPVGAADEIGDLSRAFNLMAEELSRQETLRRNLMSDVAHELRTPLTNLRCQIEAVEDGLLEPTPETVRSLREEVLLLSRLVEDLQTVAVAEAGRLSLERGPVPLREMIDGALDSVRAMAAERGVTLDAAVPELPLVDVDPTRIAQVLRNLLANALTATARGGRVVVAATADKRFATITVADSGRGVPLEHLPHVFERFYRADPSRARATGGAGLGLAIVKAIVEAHGGTVGVTSETGHGASFWFTVPLA